MNVFVPFEYSGTVRDAFIRAGHNAWSCDLLPSESDFGPHYRGDVYDGLDMYDSWDLIIAHPPCTEMGVCGNGTYAKGKPGYPLRLEAIERTLALWERLKENAPRVCLENPASVIFPHLRKRGAVVQYVQPYEYGHPETKKTGLALHGLPKLAETDNVYDYMMTLPKKERHKTWYASPGPTRGKDRAKFFPGIADAMAAQWA